MISKEHRFHGHHSLDFTYRRGKTVRGPMCSLRYVKTRGDGYRLSVVVSKKVQKSAVVRNRIRRRVYEIMRKLDSEKGLPGWDMIISVFDESFAEMPSKNLEKTIRGLVEKSLQNPPNNK
jgi:ribonuclease P protein component